ncbi:hypothetical protein FJZ26_00175 [Candidatus Parvarchaeota archaeon]|nr:hypothetical protein [Candidatus Parvarchaeota archaeon]
MSKVLYKIGLLTVEGDAYNRANRNVLSRKIPALEKMLERMCKKAKVEKPKFTVEEDETPNASIGRITFSNWVFGNNDVREITFTSGAVKKLTLSEQKFVMGHELGHDKDKYSTATGSGRVLWGVFSLGYWIPKIFMDDSPITLGDSIVYAMTLLAWSLADTLSALHHSRKNEYAADKYSAQQFAAADGGIKNFSRQDDPALGIFDLFFTHPCAERRIKRLKKLKGVPHKTIPGILVKYD